MTSEHQSRVVPSGAFFRRKYIDYMLAAILLEDFTPSSTSLAILKHVNNTLGTNSLMVGGSLRDEYRATMIDDDDQDVTKLEVQEKSPENQTIKPKDYDVHISVSDTTEARNDEHEYREDYMLERAADTLLRAPGFELVSGPEIVRIRSSDQKHSFGHLVLNFNDKIVDIGLTMDRISLEERAMYGDAVVNSIAADATGTTMSHPYFETDMKDEVHAIRVTGAHDLMRSNERFNEKARTGHYLGAFELIQPEEHFESIRAEP